MNTKKYKYNLLNLCTIVGLITIGLFIFYGYKNEIFTSIDTLREFIISFGIWTPLIFILIQVIQVILPILPGAVSCVAGVIIFGPWVGLLYNYIGISIGSIIVFMLSKRYGHIFVKGIIGEKSYKKYISWVEHDKKFDKFFAFAIFFPISPDDVLCYVAGLSAMKLKRFVTIILMGKPLSIAIYSMGIVTVVQHLIKLIK